MCRQAISEFKIPRIIMVPLKGAVQVAPLAEILPFAFTDNDLCYKMDKSVTCLFLVGGRDDLISAIE